MFSITRQNTSFREKQTTCSQLANEAVSSVIIVVTFFLTKNFN